MAKKKFGDLEDAKILEQTEQRTGRKGAEAKRSKQILVSFSPDEFERLKQLMTDKNRSFTPFAEYIRNIVLSH